MYPLFEVRGPTLIGSIFLKKVGAQRIVKNVRVGGNGGAGGAIAPPIYLKIGGNVALSTPNISILLSNAL